MSQDKIVWNFSPKESDCGITVRGVVPAGSIWFDGHFPEDPILPGVAQLAMVVDVLKETLGREVTVKRLSRIRFKSAIHPGDEATVEIRPKAGVPSTYAFHISCGNDPASSGVIEIAE